MVVPRHQEHTCPGLFWRVVQAAHCTREPGRRGELRLKSASALFAKLRTLAQGCVSSGAGTPFPNLTKTPYEPSEALLVLDVNHLS